MAELKANGCMTHLVLKNDDVYKYCSDEQIKSLADICKTVLVGRASEGKGDNAYYICNTDEPYSKDVIRKILEGEEAKKRGNTIKI